jgi:hypothetical protein
VEHLQQRLAEEAGRRVQLEQEQAGREGVCAMLTGMKYLHTLEQTRFAYSYTTDVVDGRCRAID